MSMLGEQIKELRTLADHLDERERGMDEYVVAMREAADTITSLSDKLQGVMGTRHNELFGTPERAARTLAMFSPLACSYCALYSTCGDDQDKDCLLCDYDALLEWLRGEGETE